MNNYLRQVIWVISFSSFLILPHPSAGQYISVTDSSNKIVDQNDIPDSFHFIPRAFDLPGNSYVGTIEITIAIIEGSDLEGLFKSLWSKGNNLGANTFSIENIYEFQSKQKQIIEISLHRISDEEIVTLRNVGPGNMVYIIGDLNRDAKPQKLKINDQKLYLPPYHYIACQNEVGSEIKISVGGLTGSTVWIRGKENRPPVFTSFSDFGTGLMITPGPGVGLSFHTGRSFEVEQNFGQFLIQLLPEHVMAEAMPESGVPEND